MQDFFGCSLAIGDSVAFIETAYRNFKRGEIVAVTAKKVRLRHAGPSWCPEALDETLRFPGEVIRE